MITNDFIVEQSRMIIRMLKTVTYSPDGGMIDDVNEIKFTGELSATQTDLRELLGAHEFCKAEDIVCDLIEQSEEDRNICMGIWFYNQLLDIDEETLESNDFEKEEILDGLKAIEEIKIPQ